VPRKVTQGAVAGCDSLAREASVSAARTRAVASLSLFQIWLNCAIEVSMVSSRYSYSSSIPRRYLPSGTMP